MTVTDAMVEQVRDWTGESDPTDDVIRATLGRDDVGENVYKAARIILSRRLAAIPSVTSLGVSGDVSVSFSTTALRDQIRQLDVLIGSGGSTALPAMTSTPIAPSREVAR